MDFNSLPAAKGLLVQSKSLAWVTQKSLRVGRTPRVHPLMHSP